MQRFTLTREIFLPPTSFMGAAHVLPEAQPSANVFCTGVYSAGGGGASAGALQLS